MTLQAKEAQVMFSTLPPVPASQATAPPKKKAKPAKTRGASTAPASPSGGPPGDVRLPPTPTALPQRPQPRPHLALHHRRGLRRSTASQGPPAARDTSSSPRPPLQCPARRLATGTGPAGCPRKGTGSHKPMTQGRYRPMKA